MSEKEDLKIDHLLNEKEDNFDEEIAKLRKEFDAPSVPGGHIKLEQRKTVAAIIVDGSSVLLVKRNTAPFKNAWTLPGGHIEEGEKDSEAIIREVKEETGLDFKPEYFGNYEEHFPGQQWSAIVTVFIGKHSGEVLEGEAINQEEVAQISWFDFRNIRSLDLGFDHRRILDEYQQSS